MELGTTCHERVGFIQKKNSVEMPCDFENGFKL
jgi:hypothetical protein